MNLVGIVYRVRRHEVSLQDSTVFFLPLVSATSIAINLAKSY